MLCNWNSLKYNFRQWRMHIANCKEVQICQKCELGVNQGDAPSVWLTNNQLFPAKMYHFVLLIFLCYCILLCFPLHIFLSSWYAMSSLLVYYYSSSSSIKTISCSVYLSCSNFASFLTLSVHVTYFILIIYYNFTGWILLLISFANTQLSLSNVIDIWVENCPHIYFGI